MLTTNIQSFFLQKVTQFEFQVCLIINTYFPTCNIFSKMIPRLSNDLNQFFQTRSSVKKVSHVLIFILFTYSFPDFRLTPL